MDTTQLSWDEKQHTLNVTLAGRLDSLKAPEIAKKLFDVLEGRNNTTVIVDAEKLGYISSAGLRVLLDLKKRCGDMKIINVSLDIYDILTMTGFTKFINVERRIRKIRRPAQGELISRDSDSSLYRSTNDLAVRLFDPEINLDEVQKRLKLSKIATSHGIPTPIVFEIVSCEDCYGIIFENTHGKTLAQIWDERPDGMQEETRMLAELMKSLHSTVIDKDELPDFGQRMIDDLNACTVLEDVQKQNLCRLVGSLHPAGTFVYGNLRLSNVMVMDDRLMLLDLTRCGWGNPVLDLQAAISNMFADGHGLFWKRFFARYTHDLEKEKQDILEKVLDPRIRPWWKSEPQTKTAYKE